MSRRSGLHSREYSRALIEVHPADAKTLDLRTGQAVRVASRRGECTFTVQITERVAPSHLFTTFHFAESPVNLLTGAASDPVAQCPEYKVCAVRIERGGP
jgi:predicted molibdopterin-dependent oxidoreductase YjgC